MRLYLFGKISTKLACYVANIKMDHCTRESNGMPSPLSATNALEVMFTVVDC